MRGEDRDTIREILPSLIEGFGEAGSRGDLKLRRYLALVLGTARDSRAIEALRGGLADDDPMTRLFCVWGLAEIEDRAALPDLRALMDDADPGVRKMSIFALGRMGEKEDAPRVREALDDPEVDVRWNAALALAQLGDEAAVPVLVELLDASIAGDDPQIPADAGEREVLALNAIRGLALLPTTESEAALRRAAASGDGSPIAQAARLALDGSGRSGAGFP
jgi:HEAT repeat protein